MLTRLAPYLLLTALALVFFAGLVIHPGQILYSDHSDFVVQYLPAKHFLVRSWQTDGELPLWCPEAQAGLPFVHDPQVAAFYPPNAPLYFLPDRWIGPAMSWLLVAHVILAGCGAYVYARAMPWASPDRWWRGWASCSAANGCYTCWGRGTTPLPRSPGCRWWCYSWSRRCAGLEMARCWQRWCVRPGPERCSG